MELRELSGRFRGTDPGLSPGIVQSCFLAHCHVQADSDPRNRLTVRDATVIDCKHDGCFVHGALIENSEIRNLRGGGRLGSFLRGCLFNNVVVKGPISGIEVQERFGDDNATNERYKEHAKQFYRQCKIALDIREAKFKSLGILAGIPAGLIRRDPQVHFVMHPEQEAEIRAKSTTLLVIAAAVRRVGMPTVFLIGMSSSKREMERLDECNELRARGLLS